MWWVREGGEGRVALAALVGTSTPGRPGLGLSHSTLTEFPRRPSGQEQSPGSLSHLNLWVTSHTAEEMVPAEHTLSHVPPMCSFLKEDCYPRYAGLPGPTGLKERCPWWAWRPWTCWAGGDVGLGS